MNEYGDYFIENMFRKYHTVRNSARVTSFMGKNSQKIFWIAKKILIKQLFMLTQGRSGKKSSIMHSENSKFLKIIYRKVS